MAHHLLLHFAAQALVASMQSPHQPRRAKAANLFTVARAVCPDAVVVAPVRKPRRAKRPAAPRAYEC
ncbi:hypothetical protein [Bradyrhizobium sp.]|uniref:hypothetical protein n=1 Tax=Bradyrhizobium sp. TaxID=376 RepID=UPI00260678FC|nr:hypothetical protein [Bradyrhizobium sp.]